MKASVIIPYYERPGSFEALLKVLAALPRAIPEGAKMKLEDYAEVHRLFLPACDLHLSGFPQKLRDNKILRYSFGDDFEVLIVTEEAVHPDKKNCCLQVNVGMKEAIGEVFILLQQEIIPRSNTLFQMADYIQKNPNKLIYAAVDKQRYEDDYFPVMWVGPKAQNGAWFLIAGNRLKLISEGGVDEDFWLNWGFEDTWAMWWWGEKFDVEYVEWARGVHLWHADSHDTSKFEANRQIYFEKATDPNYFPNEGKEWGRGKLSDE